MNLSPAQKKALLIGIPVVAIVALVSILKGRSSGSSSPTGSGTTGVDVPGAAAPPVTVTVNIPPPPGTTVKPPAKTTKKKTGTVTTTHRKPVLPRKGSATDVARHAHAVTHEPKPSRKADTRPTARAEPAKVAPRPSVRRTVSHPSTAVRVEPRPTTASRRPYAYGPGRIPVVSSRGAHAPAMARRPAAKPAPRPYSVGGGGIAMRRA